MSVASCSISTCYAECPAAVEPIFFRGVGSEREKGIVNKEKTVYDEEALITVAPHWHFHWSMDVKSIFEIGYHMISLMDSQQLAQLSKKDRLKMVYDEYWKTRERQAEIFKHTYPFEEWTLDRTRAIPLDVFEYVFIAMYQHYYEPNIMGRHEELIEWRRSHKEFQFCQFTDYEPIYRGPN